MKITNVTPGFISIPPNGWGAVEKIIWEFHNNLLLLGHDSHITYLNDVPSDSDIVHIHVANLALLAHERGIPYYFTMHDHHTYLYGKESPVYKTNLEAIKHAVKAFVPAKYLIEYFDGIPEYFSHGVNTLFFTPPKNRQQHKLLCVANNGYLQDQSIDRKGFGIAIEAAKALGLPITIAGPANNKNYFNKNIPTYDKVKVLYDVNEEDLLTLYKNHSIFVHASQLEAGHPNLTMLEALSCGLPVVGTLERNNSLGGVIKVSRDVVDVVLGIQEILLNYSQYSSDARHQAEKLSWHTRTKDLLKLYGENTNSMKNKLLHHYNITKPLHHYPKVKYQFHAIDGAFIEIQGGPPDIKYRVSFINKKTDKVEYWTELGRNCWARASIKYYVDWKIVVENLSTGETTEHELELNNQRVLISFESKSLGDTLSWIPYVEEFRKKHNCKIICSTFWNDLFKSEYPDIEFVSPGEQVHNLMALYRVGIFYDGDKINIDHHPVHPIKVPLQKVMSDILGLEFEEIRPKIKTSTTPKKEKQVCIAVHSTTQAKYWNNPTGWQSVVDWLNEKGYTVRLLSQEGEEYMGNKIPNDVIQHPKGSIESVVHELQKSHAFIGLGSGLSWLSWALQIPTVLISGFSYDWAEMKDCIRIGAPNGICSGCFNRVKLDAGDWNWCPDHKGTLRQFECSREITADLVIKELEKIL